MNIFEAIEENDIEKVRELLDSGIDINAPYNYYVFNSYDESTALVEACTRNRYEIVKLLLSYSGINVNALNSDECTPIYIACLNGDVRTAKLLLNHPDTDVTIRSYDQDSCLNVACEFNNIEIIDLLLNHPNSKNKIDVNNTDYESEKTSYDINEIPLLRACNNNKIEIVQLLLQHPKINVNIKGNNHTGLILACSNQNIEIVKLLLSHPDIDVNVNKGKPLQIATLEIETEKSIEILRLLLKHPKLNINIQQHTFFLALVIKYQQLDYDKSSYANLLFSKIKLMMQHPKIQFDINIFYNFYKDIPKLKPLFKKRFPDNTKVNKILDEIQE